MIIAIILLVSLAVGGCATKTHKTYRMIDGHCELRQSDGSGMNLYSDQSVEELARFCVQVYKDWSE